MITCKINCSKIDKSALFKGEKGTYLDITLLENRDGTDQYGNDYFIIQDIGKERREKGEKGPIIGNAKRRAGKPVAQTPSAVSSSAAKPTQALEDTDSVPF